MYLLFLKTYIDVSENMIKLRYLELIHSKTINKIFDRIRFHPFILIILKSKLNQMMICL